MTDSASITLLFLGAGPADQARLRQGTEVRTIQERLDRLKRGAPVQVVSHLAVRKSDVGTHLLNHQPDLVHISTHGFDAGQGQIVFEDDAGQSDPVPVRALSRLFKSLKRNIRCVVLNACFSEAQAKAIAQHIDCVIGVSEAIEDDTAITFSEQFYGTLAAGESVHTAYDVACSQVDLEDGQPSDGFVLVTRTGVNAAEVFIEPRTPEQPAPKPRWQFSWPARQRMLTWLAIGLAPFALVGLFWLLGAEVQRARAHLIGLSGTELSYPAASLIMTGLTACVRLVWYMLTGLLTGHGSERWAVLILLGLVVPALVLWRRRRVQPCVAFLAVVFPMLGYGAVLYANAVGVHHVALAVGVSEWPCALGQSVPDRIGFEVCSWLRNETVFNDGRRLALAGLWVWFALATGLLFWLSLRASRVLGEAVPRAWRMCGKGSVVAYGLLLIFVAMQASKAYALAHWGLRYPRVVTIDKRCDAQLAESARSSACRVLDVSAGADEEIIVIEGTECPVVGDQGLISARLVPSELMAPGQRCIQHTESTEVILNKGK